MNHKHSIYYKYDAKNMCEAALRDYETECADYDWDTFISGYFGN